MLKRPDGSLQFSPKDLITFLEGDFAAWMDRGHATGGSFQYSPDESDADGELIKQKGMEHEAAVLELLRKRHGDSTEIPRSADAEALTLAAMREGRPLIYQGWLSTLGWHGYPDFLIKAATPSNLGDWAYWPADSKLARSAKPYFLIQLCAYAEFLEQAQGTRPPKLGFVFGNRTEKEFDTDRFFYFYRHLKEAFGHFQARFDPATPPDPALESGFGQWETAAKAMLLERDDLRLIARITRSQIKRLRDGGVRTCASLATGSAPVSRVNAEVLGRLRRQARLQIASRSLDKPAFESLPHETDKRIGLALLPPPSPNDVFFDLEGFPLGDEPLEYLFGAVTATGNTPAFKAWWAHDSAQEKIAFEQVVDWLHARWTQDPGMHIYHYAPYEVSALRRLMGKYATRETEVDDLLRGNVLVDLYAVTRGGVAIGTSGYSLKDIEVLFAPPRTAGVADADGSIVFYHRWMQTGDQQILDAIRDYNREDCESTWRLTTWLRQLQASAGIGYIPPVEKEREEPEERPEETFATGLLARAEAEADPERKRVTELLAWLLSFYRREEKPTWWWFFERLTMTDEDLANDANCLAGLVHTDTPPVKVARSFVHEYRFDPEQDTKVCEGDQVYVLTGGEPFSIAIESFDGDAGLLTMKFGPKRTAPERCNLIPDESFNHKSLAEAVLRFAQGWKPGAIDDLLFRRPPRLSGGAKLTDELIKVVANLDNSTLCIQGPPGSGKTYNAARVIVALARKGKRIAVSSNSHKAILNLLDEVEKSVPVVKVGNDEGEVPSKALADMMADGIVAGGTVWAFARPELDQQFDYLFIDEAGQVSLANAIAMGGAARNIVLIGDQMQLSQPAQGSHPGDSGLSCLHYLLKGHLTVPRDLGVLLDTTWRLHPDICTFISDTAYEGRLKPEVHTAERCMVPGGAGIRMIELHHEGNTQSSDEEVERIAELVEELKGSKLKDGDKLRQFDPVQDLLIVAPYNAQVRCLKQRLGDHLRIASVDKFQGQEAAVVIISMCASSLDDAARGSAFLLNPNRLNVAISRAKCLAIVVASDTLVRTRPSSVAEMELLNLYCRLRYYANELS